MAMCQDLSYGENSFDDEMEIGRGLNTWETSVWMFPVCTGMRDVSGFARLFFVS